MEKKNKTSGEMRAFFERIGRLGGKARAKKHSPAKLRRWARKGGRPVTKRAA